MVQSGIEIETGHSGLSDGSAAALSLALPSSVTLSQSSRLDQHGLLRRLLAVEDLQRQRHAGAADRAGVGHRRALQALDRVELADEAGIVGADDRHQRRLRLDQRVDDHVVDARGPDAVERHAGGDEVEDLLLALVLLPAGEDLLRDLDVREFGERLLEALVAVAVGGGAGGAAHVDDVALAADLSRTATWRRDRRILPGCWR